MGNGRGPLDMEAAQAERAARNESLLEKVEDKLEEAGEAVVGELEKIGNAIFRHRLVGSAGEGVLDDARFDHELGDMDTSLDNSNEAGGASTATATSSAAQSTDAESGTAQAGDPCDPDTFDASDPKYAGLVNPRCENQAADGEASRWVVVCN